MSTCLILGGNGFIGSHTAKMLVENGYNVKILSELKSGISNIESIIDKVEIIKGNFLDKEIREKSLKDVEFVFHNISTTNPQTSILNPVYDINSNIVGTVNLLQDILNTNVQKIIFTSSGGTIYGEPSKIPIEEDDITNPICPYGISKLAIEKYLHYFNHVYGLNYTSFRYSNPYGEGQYPSKGVGIIPIFLSNIAKGKSPKIYGDGNTVRDYIYIKDITDVNLLTISRKLKSEHHIFNIGSGTGTSINELINIMSEVVENPIKTEYIDVRKGDVSKIILDITRIQKEYGWKPKTNMAEGIQNTWNWIRKIT